MESSNKRFSWFRYCLCICCVVRNSWNQSPTVRVWERISVFSLEWSPGRGSTSSLLTGGCNSWTCSLWTRGRRRCSSPWPWEEGAALVGLRVRTEKYRGILQLSLKLMELLIDRQSGIIQLRPHSYVSLLSNKRQRYDHLYEQKVIIFFIVWNKIIQIQPPAYGLVW